MLANITNALDVAHKYLTYNPPCAGVIIFTAILFLAAWRVRGAVGWLFTLLVLPIVLYGALVSGTAIAATHKLTYVTADHKSTIHLLVGIAFMATFVLAWLISLFLRQQVVVQQEVVANKNALSEEDKNALQLYFSDIVQKGLNEGVKTRLEALIEATDPPILTAANLEEAAKDVVYYATRRAHQIIAEKLDGLDTDDPEKIDEVVEEIVAELLRIVRDEHLNRLKADLVRHAPRPAVVKAAA